MTDRSGQQRELVFCHRCHNEWYRDEHGLQCPEADCLSDIVEVIEPNNDPRQMDEEEAAESESPEDTLHNHNPWADAPDPEEEDIERVEWNEDGFHYVSTTFHPGRTSRVPRTPPPREPGIRPLDPFTAIFASAFGGNGPPNTRGPTGPHDRPSAALDHPILGSYPPSNVRSTNRDGPDVPGERVNVPPAFPTFGAFGGAMGPTGFRATIYPRGPTTTDPHTRQTTGPPLDDLTGILNALFQNIHANAGGPNGANANGATSNPFTPLMLFNQILNPANARAGDAVYTQEALDRVISQLMEQHSTSTAPGPASADAISALPKISIEKEMLDSNGKAECSICMDNVEIGAKVTQLPCKHWFHGECVGEWLRVHDTCPQCRRSITPKEGDSNTPRETGQTPRNMGWLWGNTSTEPESPTRGMRHNPHIIPDSPERPRAPHRRSSAHDHPRPERRSSSHSQDANEASSSSRGGGFLGWAERHFGGGGSSSGSGGGSGSSNGGPSAGGGRSGYT